MKTKPRRTEIPPNRANLRLVRPARLKSEVHRANVRPQRKPKKYG